MDYLLSALINVFAVGFASIMVLDFANGLLKLWVSVALTASKRISIVDTPADPKVCNLTATPDQKPRYAPPILDAKGARDLMTLTEPAPEEEYLRSELPTPAPLLSSALEVVDQPVLVTLGSTELRKLCKTAGISWRNYHALNKHLSKVEMVTALSSLTI